MGVTKRSLTPRQGAANRRNARRSTGPRTPEGKRRSRMNALRHGLCTKAFREVMVELREDPREFDRLHRGLVDSLAPHNALESTLVEDLAKLWWKKARAERAQAGVQLREVERMETARLKEIHEVNRDALDEPQEEIMEKGVLRARDCTGKFEDALRLVEILRAHVEGRMRCENVEGVLQALYGKKPSWHGGMVVAAFNDLEDAEAKAAGEQDPEETDPAVLPGAPDGEASPADSARLNARLLLLEETRDLYGQHEVFLRQHVDMSDAVRDSYLAPTDSRWTWMLRMDNYLERQIERKLKLLMQLRRFNARDAAPPTGPRGGNGRQTRKKVKDVKMQKRSHQVVEHKGSGSGPFFRMNAKRTHSHPERSQIQGTGDRSQGREAIAIADCPSGDWFLVGKCRVSSFDFPISAFADTVPRFQKLACETSSGRINSAARL
ncbi:MAG TPA: hypothetical protein VM182_12300 [Terriglobia bacterium]|nr:hypothetical protein [Terriglobia bacterium]